MSRPASKIAVPPKVGKIRSVSKFFAVLGDPGQTTTMQIMMTEVTRLALGLLIALFHKPLSDYIVEQDRALVALARNRGVTLPQAPPQETARNLYFGLGIFIAMYEIVRIWMLMH